MPTSAITVGDGRVDLVGGLGAGGADLDASPARGGRSSAAAIWERPALWTQTNRTSGMWLTGCLPAAGGWARDAV